MIIVSFILTFFFIYVIVLMNKKNNNIVNSDISNKYIRDKALSMWSKELKNKVNIDLEVNNKNTNNDIHIASSNIIKYKHNYIKGIITLYTPYYTLSDEDKLKTFLHEIGHLLGIGTKWNNKTQLHKKNYPLTISEFNLKYNKNVDYINVKNGHWNEPELKNDIMYNTGGNNAKITRITLMNLKDIGWNI